MTPGTYLAKRRAHAGLSLQAVARAIAALPWAIRPPAAGDIARLTARLEAAEADRDNLTVAQAQLLRNAFAFDVDIYQRLLWRHVGDRSVVPPQLCRTCACSWCDPCLTHDGPCGWSEPDLCSACKRAEQASSELAAAAAAQAEVNHRIPA